MELISYAQNYEDIRLWRAFRDVEIGRYLDIGTQEPNHDSVSRLFYDRGWRGVHVEPTPTYAAAMRDARPDETVIEATVSNSPLPIKLFEIPGTGLSTGVPEIAQFHQEAGWTYREILVPTITLASLLESMGEDPIHWLKIDVEGMEADVLASWGDHPTRPAALVIEATKPNTQEQTHGVWHEMVTSRGYSEVLFDGLSRYFIHESHAARGDALALSPNVFDGFKILRSHFSAGRIAVEVEQTVAHLREEAEALARGHAEQLAQVTADASAQLDAALQRAVELEGRLVSEVEAHAQAMAGAQAAAAEASAQLEAALQRAGELEGRLASEAEAHAHALAGAQAAAAEAFEQLDAALRRAGELEAQLAAAVAAHDAERAQASSVAADLQAKLDDALGKAGALEQQLASETAAHEAASAALAKISAEFDVAQTRSAELQERVQEQARLHAAAVSMAEDRTTAAQRALGEANGKLAELQAEHLALGRHAGRMEGQLEVQAKWFEAMIAEAASRHDDLRDRLHRAEQELAALRDLAADLRLELANETARAEAAAAATAEEKRELNASLGAAREVARQLTEQAAQLTESLAVASLQRDEFGAQVQQLSQERAGLFGELEATRNAADQLDLALRGEIENLRIALASHEHKIAAAEELLATVPDPLNGSSGLRKALMRRLIGSAVLSAIADHRTALAEWHRDMPDPGSWTIVRGGDNTLDCGHVDRHGPAKATGAPMSANEHPITSVAQLLAPHDQEFVHAAYWSVLGRAPDPEGEFYYLARLRSGVHKLAILKQMRHSPEGHAFIPAVAGLDRAIKRHLWATKPIVGVIVRLITGADGDSSSERHLRVIANELGRLNQSNSAVLQAVRVLGVTAKGVRDEQSSPVAPIEAAPIARVEGQPADVVAGSMMAFDGSAGGSRHQPMIVEEILERFA